MITLFLDIDNTLIFSHRHNISTPKRTAELLNGKNQSYITERTYTFLSKQENLQIVPVTTRTLSQYRRIENLLREIGCVFSLVCNGAVLLRNGEIEPNWLDESMSLSADERQELPVAAQWLREKSGLNAVHFASDLFVYAGVEDPDRIASELRQIVDSQRVEILCDSRKVYCVPKTLNKGKAIQRFILQNNVSFSVVAGDSDFDVPMLNLGDVAILPASLSDKVQNERKITVEETQCFSDEVCRCLETLLEEHRDDRNGAAVWNNH